jgi:hypothetical protein
MQTVADCVLRAGVAVESGTLRMELTLRSFTCTVVLVENVEVRAHV